MSFSILFPTNQYASASKSPEEIHKLTLTHLTSPPEIINHIINKGIPLQYPYVYKLCDIYPKMILQFACERLCVEQPENQMLIIESLQKLLQTKYESLGKQDLEMIFKVSLQALNNLQSGNNQYIAKIIQFIIKKSNHCKALLRTIEEKCTEFGKISQPIIEKVTAGRYIALYSKYCKTLKPEMIDIIKRILSINEIQTKKIWISELFPQLLANLDLEFIELHLQEKMFQLVYDQNEEISRIVVQTILLNSSKFSLQEQSTRIIKLFMDAISSKNQKIVLNISPIIGQVFTQLINYVFKSQSSCVNFWKSIISLYNSKNQAIVNSLVYHLPGILKLTSPFHNTEPLCDLYIDMFYCTLANKELLAKYFHQMVKMFPNKWVYLKQLAYEMMSELFESSNVSNGAIKIVNNIFYNLRDIWCIFIRYNSQIQQKDILFEDIKIFQEIFLQYLMNNVSKWLEWICLNLIDCVEYIPQEFIEKELAPKIYLSLKTKISNTNLFLKLFVILITKDNNPNLLNTYISKVNIELCKSKKSSQRQIALLFYHNLTFYISMELFSEYRIGQKFLSFNNDKNFKIKNLLIVCLPRMQYFFGREQKMELQLIIERLKKDNDQEIIETMKNTSFLEDDSEKCIILSSNLILREKQKKKEVNAGLLKNQQKGHLKSNKELKKDDMFKKRIETTKTKNKMQLRDVAKRKLTPLFVKTSSSYNFNKNA